MDKEYWKTDALAFTLFLLTTNPQTLYEIAATVPKITLQPSTD